MANTGLQRACPAQVWRCLLCRLRFIVDFMAWFPFDWILVASEQGSWMAPVLQLHALELLEHSFVECTGGSGSAPSAASWILSCLQRLCTHLQHCYMAATAQGSHSAGSVLPAPAEWCPLCKLKKMECLSFPLLLCSPRAAHDPQAGAMAQPAAAAALGEHSSSPAGTLERCRAGNTLCSSLLKPAGP